MRKRALLAPLRSVYVALVVLTLVLPAGGEWGHTKLTVKNDLKDREDLVMYAKGFKGGETYVDETRPLCTVPWKDSCEVTLPCYLYDFTFKKASDDSVCTVASQQFLSTEEATLKVKKCEKPKK
jgi:hypothetical protein